MRDEVGDNRAQGLVYFTLRVDVADDLTADQLAAIFNSRYPQLYDYESATYFDANGRKIWAATTIL